MGRVSRVFVFALAALTVACFCALKFGAVSGMSWERIVELRLPRLILAIAIGMGLSVSGVVLQALFSNPLCEPYTLGVSSGAAVGAVLGTSLGLSWTLAGLAMPAFLGAIVFASVLLLISIRTHANNSLLLLAGVMLGFLGNGIVTLWIALSEANGIQAALVWLFGDLSRARLMGSLFSITGVMLIGIVIWTYSRKLDALLLGEEGAIALGVNVGQTRRMLILLAALLVGICVSAGGMIGFVGLVTPHFSRRWVGSLHRQLIPLAALWGATSLAFADTLSRWLSRPYELPVGVVTALFGAPLFLWIMLKNQSRA